MKELSINVRKVKVDDICKIIDIIDFELGKNYVEVESINNYLNDEQFECIVAEVNSKIVGVAFGCIKEKQEALKYIKLTETQIPLYARVSEKVGVIKTVAVLKQYQGRGVGTVLVNKLLENMINQNIHVVSAVAWMHDDILNIGGLLNRIEMIPYITIQDYWKDESLAEGFNCPICGEPPCKCSAVIYFKSI